MGLFDRIREAAAEVADRAQWVTLKTERLDTFANELVPGPAAQTDAGAFLNRVRIKPIPPTIPGRTRNRVSPSS